MRISPKTFADLVQHVYGAPLDPGGWEALLTVLCATLESKSAALVTYDFASREAQMHAAAGADPALLPLYEHYSPKNPFMPAVAAHVVSGFVGVSGEFMPDRELLKTEYFNEYMLRAGYHHNLALCLQRIGDVATMIYPVRDLGRPPFSRQDLDLCRALVPHLSRAFLIHRRLQAADVRESVAVQVLDQLALGVCVLDGRGRTVFVNGSAREMLRANDGLGLGRDGLSVAHPGEREKMHRAVAEATRDTAGDGVRVGRALRISRPSLRRAFEVLVVPSTSTRLHDLGVAAAVVFIGDPERRIEAWDALLMRLYDLTASEARTALLLLQGHRVQEIADQHAVSLNTTRTHLKRIFMKTGARTQSDLVRLLLSGPAQLRSAAPSR